MALLLTINVKSTLSIATPTTHLFVGMHPSLPPSKLMEQVKSGSSKWLNEKKYIAGKFQWQDGYGIFLFQITY